MVRNNSSAQIPQLIASNALIQFQEQALVLFRDQYKSNHVYRDYCDALRFDPANVQKLNQIPFLPIAFFKTHKVVTGTSQLYSLVFESSGTTSKDTSYHYIADPTIYRESLVSGFRQFYGNPSDYTILALLPSYLDRQNASLVYMAKTLMDIGNHPQSGFYINEWQQLHNVLLELEHSGRKTLLLGVTFALLDFAEAYPMSLHNTIVMETGGMKGRREEMIRASVHEFLCKRWGLTSIHSEYGMTELLSQAYSQKNGIFCCTETMNILVRDINDPLDIADSGTGCLNIIDLANINSCSFIATDDLGTVYTDSTFEVRGRLDHSALRGCNLMVL